ncbi:membrane protein [Sulfurisphaera javensis]|uniref:Membrane protein n=1 Tax=Sulfurisphaera javensis TaxID=2049879 RepID=A0AAT9GUH5_9CREN
MSQKLLTAFKMILRDDKSSFRRYIVLGAFDGLLVALSIIVSSAIAKTPIPKLIPLTLSGIVGVSLSSMWNTIVVELKEREEDLKELERQMMRSLRGTVYDYSMKIGVILSTIAHTLSPFIGLVPLLIYILFRNITLTILLSAGSLSVLGIFYEGELREKIFTIVLMVMAGLVSALLSILITTSL